MKIVVGSDHAGFPMKAELLAFLQQQRDGFQERLRAIAARTIAR